MRKTILLFSATAIWATHIQAQTTTYGSGGNLPLVLDNGYMSDYSTDGTIVLSDGSVTMSNSATYEHGNTLLQNDGSWNSQSGSNDLFVGPGSTTISGSNAPDFFNANFNNGATAIMYVTNAEGINVSGQLQFNNSITTSVRANTATGAIHFADGATYTGGTTDLQHVNGYVSKAGNDAFTFPVGSGTDARALSISAPTPATELSVAWFAGSPSTVSDPSDAATHSITSLGVPLLSVSEVGFWDWIPVSGSDDGLTVTVSMPDVSFYSVTANLRLAGWNGTQWIDLSGNATANGNTEGSTLSGVIPVGNNITAIAIASTAIPLPVHFSAFTANAAQCAVQLQWTTADERNCDHFTVLRSSDGIAFEALGKVQASGNAGSSYSYTDAAPLQGPGYYRIRATDHDGSETYTAVRQVQTNCPESDIRVYPTLTSDAVTIELPERYHAAKVGLHNTLGQLLQCPLSGDPGHRVIRLGHLPAAQYLLIIATPSESRTFKLLKQ